MQILSILAALLLLGILVTVHEAGHFLAARLTGIEVMEFAIGFGPKLFSRKSRRTGTVFTLRVIPVGGFCAFYGEDDAEGKYQSDPRAMNRQPVWKRLITVAMGPVMNFVLALVVTFLYFWIGGVPQQTGIDPFVSEVIAGGPADRAGLEANDVILTINGVNVLDGTMDGIRNQVSTYHEGDEPLLLEVQRGQEKITATLTPRFDEAEGRYMLGVMLGGYYRIEVVPCGPGTAIASAWRTCVNAGGLIITSLRDLVTTGAGLEQTSGPVGIVTMVSQEVQQNGFDAFVNFLVVISINLGIMNLLPIPGLDGSRLVFLIVEGIRRKPIDPRKEAVIHLCGMLLLFALIILITFKDIFNLFS